MMSVSLQSNMKSLGVIFSDGCAVMTLKQQSRSLDLSACVFQCDAGDRDVFIQHIERK